MYNKKCNSTFLIVVALLCFFTLVVPFMNVGFYGTTPLILKILYYIFITIFIICIVLIIVIGIYNLFKNNFFLTPIQNVLSYIALIALLLNLLLFSPCRNCNLTVGYSILTFETFFLTCFDFILRLLKKLPKVFKGIKEYLKELKVKRQERKEILIEDMDSNENEETKEVNEDIDFNSILDDENAVEIIPPDEEML